MKPIVKFSEILNEMINHPKFNEFGDKTKEYFIISFDKYIYTIPTDNLDMLIDFVRILQKNNKKSITVSKYAYADDIISDIVNIFPNVLIFTYTPSEADTITQVKAFNSNQDIRTSKQMIDTLKYVNTHYGIKHLANTSNVTFRDVVNNTYDISILIDMYNGFKVKKLPDYLYHGTALDNLESILKVGIRPNPDNTNFMYITHNKRVFLSSDIYNAMFYANRAGGMTNSPAIILKINTAGLDTTKIDFDFDFYIDYIDNKNSNHDYVNMVKSQNIPDNKKPKTLAHLKDKYVGSTYRKLAYKGAIYPKYIDSIHYNIDNHNVDFKYIADKSEFSNLIEKYNYLKKIGEIDMYNGFDLTDYHYNELKDSGDLQEHLTIKLFDDYEK